VLEGDPGSEAVGGEAEQDIAELKAGDEAVRNKLDALIEGHHSLADRSSEGAGTQSSVRDHRAGGMANDAQDVVVQLTTVGISGHEPVLMGEPEGPSSLHPAKYAPRHQVDSYRSVESAWNPRTSLYTTISDLSVEVRSVTAGAEVDLVCSGTRGFP